MQWRGNYNDLIEGGQGDRIVVGGGWGDCGNFRKLGKFSGGHKKKP